MKCLKNIVKLEPKDLYQILIFILIIGWMMVSYNVLTNEEITEPVKINSIESYCDYLNKTHEGNITNCEQIYVNHSIGWNITQKAEVS